MRIPADAARTSTYALASVGVAVMKGSGKNKSGDAQMQQWSSLIGIVTAIVGNILISFALNTQRYAHMRLEREYNDSKSTSSTGDRQQRKIQGYGATQQEQLAEERARLNATAPGPGVRKLSKAGQDDTPDADENTPLKDSYESDDTAHDEKDGEDSDDGRKSYLKSPYWWVGIILMTVGEAGNFLAYGFAPASIVSPLGVVALIVNCIIAPFVLKENFRARDGWGVVVAIAGAVTVVLSAKQTEKKMGPDDLWEAIKRWEFLTYIGITAGFIILLMALSPRYGSRTVLIDLGLVGLFGGYTALSTKGVASMLSVSLWHAFAFPITYFLVIVLVVSAVLQIRYVNKALQNFNSTQVIPTQFVMFTISVVVGSAVLYREFESVTVSRMIKFVGGCLLTFVGVYLITSGARKGQSSEDEEDDEHEVQGIHLLDEEGTHSEVTPMSKRPDVYDTLPRPVTPVRHEPAEEDEEEDEAVPSIAVTPDPSSSAQPSPILNHNPYLSSTDHLDKATPEVQPPAFPRSQSELPRTPQFRHLQFDTASSTPYYTPETPQHVSRQSIQRSTSSIPNPETPTKSKRTASPPKPDPYLRPSPAPNSLARSARGSIGRLLGPFMVSPSLSGVVADSLRKEESRMSLRRRRSSRADRRNSVAADEEMGQGLGPDVAEVVEGDGSVRDKKSRLRAMSEGVSGLMKKMQRREGNNGEEGSNGPG